ncbi:MAG TPA: RcpC/CpaB family pilus assembly protein [Candidatus Dormibacteraeota bacterium]
MAVAQAPARPRSGGGRIFIIIGLVLALVAFGLVVLFSSIGNRVGGGGASCPCSLVVYASKDIALRTQITTLDQVKVKSIPDAYKPAGAVVIDSANSTKDSAGQNAAALKAVQTFIAEVNIAADQPLLTSMLAKPGDTVSGAQAALLPIPAGYVAITLPTSELIGVGGYPQAGDFISVLASFGNGKSGVTQTVFTQLHILRVGPANLTVTSASNNSSNSAAGTSAPASSITVVVTPCQSELINWFQNNMTLRYELESYHDYAPAATGPDPKCVGLSAAHGLQASDIASSFPVFAKSLTGP